MAFRILSTRSKNIINVTRNGHMGAVANARLLSTTETYTEKQAKKGRPVSPHVSIYKFPITALTSITNRVTGTLLSVGVTGIAGLSVVGVDVASTMSTLGSITAIGYVLKFGVSFPLIYHYLGGIRHLVWDKLPETMLQADMVEKSSYILVGSSAALSVGVTLLL